MACSGGVGVAVGRIARGGTNSKDRRRNAKTAAARGARRESRGSDWTTELEPDIELNTLHLLRDFEVKADHQEHIVSRHPSPRRKIFVHLARRLARGLGWR